MGNFLSIIRRILPGGTQDHQTASSEAANTNTVLDNRQEGNLSRKSSSDSSVSSKSDEFEKKQEESRYHSTQCPGSLEELVGISHDQDSESKYEALHTDIGKADVEAVHNTAVSDGREQIGSSKGGDYEA